jgi:hypothetical protein
MPVHAIDHSISRKDGVNHNMLVLLNNFWIGLLGHQAPAPVAIVQVNAV